MVYVPWICQCTKMYPHHNQIQPPGSPPMDWWEPQKVDPEIHPPGHQSTSSLPCRLNKPVYTAMSQSYSDIFKKQFSLALTAAMTDPANNWPLWKHPATIIDYDSNKEQSTTNLMNNLMATAAPAAMPNETTTTTNSTSSLCSLLPPSTPKDATVDYAVELASLWTELQSLQNLITIAVVQLKTEIVSLNMSTPHQMQWRSLLTTPRKPHPIFQNSLLNWNLTLQP